MSPTATSIGVISAIAKGSVRLERASERYNKSLAECKAVEDLDLPDIVKKAFAEKAEAKLEEANREFEAAYSQEQHAARVAADERRIEELTKQAEPLLANIARLLDLANSEMKEKVLPLYHECRSRGGTFFFEGCDAALADALIGQVVFHAQRGQWQLTRRPIRPQ
ncbi:hypothetical protein IQ216_07205 [Cyanobium sp. LEGE 06143]|uniref:hypothetical protein n=1 Tax=Cyanobium sp. LEGE 06143 TaxID=945727 RepID=UPI0018827F1A|nr:hypothetical protein [Cyanobium sp. LEGE 06143]MBE9172875.1 hypothetical protein [Cyanobium sp. LEGE 06143]